MPSSEPKTLMLVFFATWVALIVGLTFFRYQAPVELRRRLRVPIALAVPTLFLLFVVQIMGANMPWFMIVAVIVITAMNITTQRVCAKCGADARNPNIFSFTPPAHCQKCGAKLD